MELLAALAGSFYLYKNSSPAITKYLVAFLWITFFVEVLATYAPIAYFTNYEYFSFVEGTKFAKNKWLYNCYSIFSYSFLSYYFVQFVSNQIWKNVFYLLILSYVAVALVILLVTDVFFRADSMFTLLAGTLVLILSIVLFYFELLKSDIILKLRTFLPLYISIGVLVFNLCAIPVDIFSEYFSAENQVFVKLRVNVYIYTNMFMYGIFIIGFILCKKKQ